MINMGFEFNFFQNKVIPFLFCLSSPSISHSLSLSLSLSFSFALSLSSMHS